MDSTCETLGREGWGGLGPWEVRRAPAPAPVGLQKVTQDRQLIQGKWELCSQKDRTPGIIGIPKHHLGGQGMGVCV